MSIGRVVAQHNAAFQIDQGWIGDAAMRQATDFPTLMRLRIVQGDPDEPVG